MALVADVMSQEECAALIELARPRLAPSTVVDPTTGQDTVAQYRNSVGMFFRLRESDLVARLDRRISDFMGLPVEHGEGFQVLRYSPGGQTSPHFDFLVPSNAANQASIARSGQRVSTLIIYLNDVESGGETVFPETGWSVIPRRGHGVHFEYANSLGQVDRRTLHAGQPVFHGEKMDCHEVDARTPLRIRWVRAHRVTDAPDAAARPPSCSSPIFRAPGSMATRSRAATGPLHDSTDCTSTDASPFGSKRKAVLCPEACLPAAPRELRRALRDAHLARHRERQSENLHPEGRPFRETADGPSYRAKRGRHPPMPRVMVGQTIEGDRRRDREKTGCVNDEAHGRQTNVHEMRPHIAAACGVRVVKVPCCCKPWIRRPATKTITPITMA